MKEFHAPAKLPATRRFMFPLITTTTMHPFHVNFQWLSAVYIGQLSASSRVGVIRKDVAIEGGAFTVSVMETVFYYQSAHCIKNLSSQARQLQPALFIMYRLFKVLVVAYISSLQ